MTQDEEKNKNKTKQISVETSTDLNLQVDITSTTVRMGSLRKARGVRPGKDVDLTASLFCSELCAQLHYAPQKISASFWVCAGLLFCLTTVNLV